MFYKSFIIFNFTVQSNFIVYIFFCVIVLFNPSMFYFPRIGLYNFFIYIMSSVWWLESQVWKINKSWHYFLFFFFFLISLFDNGFFFQVLFHNWFFMMSYFYRVILITCFTCYPKFFQGNIFFFFVAPSFFIILSN
jgi:hypothetical protein